MADVDASKSAGATLARALYPLLDELSNEPPGIGGKQGAPESTRRAVSSKAATARAGSPRAKPWTARRWRSSSCTAFARILRARLSKAAPGARFEVTDERREVLLPRRASSFCLGERRDVPLPRRASGFTQVDAVSSSISCLAFARGELFAFREDGVAQRWAFSGSWARAACGAVHE